MMLFDVTHDQRWRDIYVVVLIEDMNHTHIPRHVVKTFADAAEMIAGSGVVRATHQSSQLFK